MAVWISSISAVLNRAETKCGFSCSFGLGGRPILFFFNLQLTFLAVLQTICNMDALKNSSVIVKIEGVEAWGRFHENGIPGGFTAQSKTLMENVVSVLEEATEQAKGSLSLMSHNGH